MAKKIENVTKCEAYMASWNTLRNELEAERDFLEQEILRCVAEECPREESDMIGIKYRICIRTLNRIEIMQEDINKCLPF